jgi:hypothetical protein
MQVGIIPTQYAGPDLMLLKSHALSSLPVSVLLDVSTKLGCSWLLRHFMQHLEGEKRSFAVVWTWARAN